MKRFLLCLLAVSGTICAQVQNIPNTTFPAVRTLLNSNFSWLNTNKAGNSACTAGQFGVETLSTGLRCVQVSFANLGGALTITQVNAAFSGTCDATTFHRGDGACTVPPGAGDIADAGTITAGNADKPVVVTDNKTIGAGTKTGTGTEFVMSQTPTIVLPTIASFSNSTHNHQNAAGGGMLAIAALGGTKTGTTSNYATATAGAKTTGNYPRWDANGNLDDGSTAPGGAHTQNTDTGTTATTFQIDSSGSGPKLKNNGGTLEARNAADNAYAAMKAASFEATGSGNWTPGTAGSSDLGSAVLPFRYLFIAGSSSTPATNNFEFLGASTGGTRTITLPDANSVTVVPDTGATNNFLTGITFAGAITKGQPSVSNLSDGTAVTKFTSGTADASGNCVVGSRYLRTDTNESWDCTSPNHWTKLGAAGAGYATVQDEGTGLTQRATINFIGAGVTCADNAGSTRTDCTIQGGGVGTKYVTPQFYPAASYSKASTTAYFGTGWNAVDANYCTVTNVGTDHKPVLQFSNAATQTCKLNVRIPLQWDGTTAISATLQWANHSTLSASATAQFTLEAGCYAEGDANNTDPTYGAAVQMTGASGTVVGAAYATHYSVQNLTLPAGCVAGREMILRLIRTPGTNDTHTAPVNVTGIGLAYTGTVQ